MKGDIHLQHGLAVFGFMGKGVLVESEDKAHHRLDRLSHYLDRLLGGKVFRQVGRPVNGDEGKVNFGVLLSCSATDQFDVRLVLLFPEAPARLLLQQDFDWRNEQRLDFHLQGRVLDERVDLLEYSRTFFEGCFG
jgi:hypothetical protein